ncbi:MAG: hypothetical protein R3178_01760 [Rhodothermales bacterium]|nr:hypothetical protein [Rhodothermales bacterium]
MSDHSGRKHGTEKGALSGNRLSMEIMVPDAARDALYAEFKLPKHGLKQRSPPLLLTPPIQITNVKWDKQEARRGDTLQLTADVDEVADGTDAEVTIFEHDADGAHDLVTKFDTKVDGGKVELAWGFEYHEDTDDIPTEEEAEQGYQSPEYFFRVDIFGVTADSELLTFVDWMEIELLTRDGRPIGNEDYVIRLPDGSERRGRLDEMGRATETDVPPGGARVEFPEL